MSGTRHIRRFDADPGFTRAEVGKRYPARAHGHRGLTAAQAGLAWPPAQKPFIVLIPGTTIQAFTGKYVVCRI